MLAIPSGRRSYATFLLAGLLAFAALGSASVTRATVAAPSPTVDRYAGASRFDTAAAISTTTFAPGVAVAYVAYAYNFPDALAGAAAAGTVKGPVLLVAQSGAINPSTAAELARLKPGRIIVLGGPGVVSDAVKAALVPYATTHVVDRYAGASRFDTAAVISAHTFTPGVAVAYVAYAYNFPDALAGAAAAGTVKGPVLLVAQSGAINSSTAAELARLKPGRIIVLGGPGVVSDAVKAALVPFATSRVVDRYAGSSRFDTAAVISAHTFTPGVDVAYVAYAFNFPDALAGAAAAGAVKGPVLLVSQSGALNAATKAEFARLQPKRIVALGGTSVVSDAVLDAAAAAAAPPPETALDAGGAELMRLTNLDRVALGKPALAVDPMLASLAANDPFTCPSDSTLTLPGRAQDMADRGYFAHAIKGCAEASGFYTVLDIMYAPFGYHTYRGENIAVNSYPNTAATYTVGCDVLGANCRSATPSTATVGVAEIEFMMSPAHRANILGDFDRFGCGSASTSDGHFYYSCLFSFGGPA